MPAPAYCPRCNAAQPSDATSCRACGMTFDATTRSGPGADEQALAQGLLIIQGLWLKLVVGRVLGLVVGLAIWWFVAGPMFGNNFLPTLVALAVLAFGGLLVGQMIVLQALTGGRRR